MRVLVTGGAGFIGSHVADALRRRGDEVVILDDFSSGLRENVLPGTEVIAADISRPGVIKSIAATRADAVIHAAAQASVPQSMADPARDRAINLLGTQHVVEGARRLGGARMIFLSTGGGIYGETEVPATEESLPRPKSFYSLHKYTAEMYIAFSGLPYGIARIANVYGPRQRSHLEGGVVAIFAERLQTGQPIVLHGTGEQRRDFVHVWDVADAILTLLDGGRSGTWNVGTGRETTIMTLLARMQAMFGAASEIRREPPRVGDVFRSCLSAEKIRDELGWAPSISLDDGLASLRQERRAIPA